MLEKDGYFEKGVDLPREPLLIIPLRHGQLGNSLCTIAHLMAVAIEFDLGLIHLGFGGYADYFESFRNSLLTCYPQPSALFKLPKVETLIEGFRQYVVSSSDVNSAAEKATEQLLRDADVERLNSFVDPSMRQLLANFGAQLNTSLVEQNVGTDPTQPVRRLDIGYESSFALEGTEFQLQLDHEGVLFLDGWGYRTETLLEKHWGVIREYLSPAEIHQRAVEALKQQARENCDLLVGVHIRRGDYREWENGRYYFEFSEYAAFMRHLMTIFPDKKTNFLVVSDEKLSSTYFPGLPVVFGTGVPIEDILALSVCDFIVGPTSTFAGWAATIGSLPYYRIADIHAFPPLEHLGLR